MKRYNERQYDIWRTIVHEDNPAIISICWLVMARIYSPVFYFDLSTVLCRKQLILVGIIEQCERKAQRASGNIIKRAAKWQALFRRSLDSL